MAWALGVDGRSADGLQSPHRPPKALCGSCDARDGERIRSRGLSRPGWREIAGTLGQLQAGRQAGNGMACSRAKARLNWVRPAPGEMQSEAARRRVIRPTRAKTRRLRVLVITVRSPRPIRAVQRARLCAITWTASQAPLAAKRPDGMWFSPTVLEVAYGVPRRRSASRRLPIDVIAVSGEEVELGTGYGRAGGASVGLERGVSRLGDIGGAVHPVGNGSLGASMRLRRLLAADGDGEADIHLAADGYHECRTRCRPVA